MAGGLPPCGKHAEYTPGCWICDYIARYNAQKSAPRVQEGDEQPDALTDHSGDAIGLIEATLAQRGSRYGKFTGHAKIAQGMKQVMVDSPNWLLLDPDQREALEMVAHKIGRILNGDPHYHDSWHDIVGYAKLVADRLEPESAQ